MQLTFTALPKELFGKKIIYCTFMNREKNIELAYAILSGLVYLLTSNKIDNVSYKIRNRNASSDFSREFSSREIFPTKEDLINYLDHYQEPNKVEYKVDTKFDVDAVVYFVDDSLKVIPSKIKNIKYTYSIDGNYETFYYLLECDNNWYHESKLFNSLEEAKKYRNKLIDSFLEQSERRL